MIGAAILDGLTGPRRGGSSRRVGLLDLIVLFVVVVLALDHIGLTLALVAVGFLCLALRRIGWPASAAPGAAEGAGRATPAAATPSSERVFTVSWEPTTGPLSLDAAGKIRFPRAPTAPGLYRFRLRVGGVSSVYIGEAANLRRRFAGYRNPGPTTLTNIRLNARIREALTQGWTGDVTLLSPTCLWSDGTRRALDLSSKERRVTIERALVAAARATGADVLNL